MFIGFLILPLSLFLLVGYFLGYQPDFLKLRPESFVLYTYLFGMPHILATSFMFVDNGYVNEFKNKLIFGGIACIGVVFGLDYLGYEKILNFILIATLVVHIIGQQVGISYIYLKQKNNFLVAAKWAGIISYIGAFIAGSESNTSFYIFIGWAILSNLLIFLGLKAKSFEKTGLFYLILYQLAVGLSLLSFNLGLLFIGVMTLRVIHDVSAFNVYSHHNRERNKEKRRNPILGNQLIPIKFLFIATPVICIGLNIARIELVPGSNFHSNVLSVLALFHYYVEYFAWQSKHTPRNFTKGLYKAPKFLNKLY